MLRSDTIRRVRDHRAACNSTATPSLLHMNCYNYPQKTHPTHYHASFTPMAQPRRPPGGHCWRCAAALATAALRASRAAFCPSRRFAHRASALDCIQPSAPGAGWRAGRLYEPSAPTSAGSAAAVLVAKLSSTKARTGDRSSVPPSGGMMPLRGGGGPGVSRQAVDVMSATAHPTTAAARAGVLQNASAWQIGDHRSATSAPRSRTKHQAPGNGQL